MPEDVKKPGEQSTPPVQDPTKDVNGDKSKQNDVNQPAAGEKTDPALLLTKLNEERDRRRAAESRVDQVKTLYGDQVSFDANGNPIAPVQQQPQPGTQPDIQKKLDDLWEQDPRKAVQAEMALGFQWYDNVNANLDMQRSATRAKYSDFNKYEAQSLQYVRSLPIEQRAKPGVVELAYLVQKGSDSDSIYKQATEDVLRKIKAGESVQGLVGSQSQSSTPEGKQPTDMEIKAAEAMGVPIADYMKARK